MELETDGSAEWLDRLAGWPEARFPRGDLGPHEHTFATNDDARRYNLEKCPCCGLRLLHLWLNSRDWVRRRSESVTFIDDRTVRRHVTIDFIVPDYAPLLSLGGRDLHTLPIAMAQKKSLINFDLRDYAGAALSLLGLRQQQNLTAAVLKGLAATLPGKDPTRPLTDHVGRLIECLVFATARWYGAR
jgi:hypothetical protein